jgi:hypothetical protein
LSPARAFNVEKNDGVGGLLDVAVFVLENLGDFGGVDVEASDVFASGVFLPGNTRGGRGGGRFGERNFSSG